MSQILRLRVILDTEDDVFRDVEIATDAPLMHLHFAVLDAFGWQSGELASFFQSDEAWGRGQEFSLMDMSDPLAEEGSGPADAGSSTVGHLVPDLKSRAIYVYDFLRMWCFYVEPLALEDAVPGRAYPALCHEFGTPPAFDSKDDDLLDGMGLELPEEDDETPYRTGDPELDAYLDGDDDDDGYDGQDHLSIDDLDDLI